VKFGGNTPSVEIQVDGRAILLDAGTGIIPLGRELTRTKRTGEILLVLSHLHHDHIQGFPFFAPAYLPGTKLYIFGPDGTHETLKKVLKRNQSSDTFPIGLQEMASSKKIRGVRETQGIVWEEGGVRMVESGAGLGHDAVVIRIHKSYAHPGGVFIYRITWRGRSVVYATDIEGYVGTDNRLVKFAQGADVLIHDAQYSEKHYRGLLTGFSSTQGFGHSTISMACDVAAAAEVKQLVLFHHDPAYDDTCMANNEKTAQALFPAAITAFEGLEVVLQVENRRSFPLNTPHGREVQYAENG
jgi:ribonuclease BN (tRNA processing enzyme)